MIQGRVQTSVFCEHGNENSGSKKKKNMELLDLLSNYRLFKEDTLTRFLLIK
jgi:hypothetical protein